MKRTIAIFIAILALAVSWSDAIAAPPIHASLAKHSVRKPSPTLRRAFPASFNATKLRDDMRRCAAGQTQYC